MLHKLRNNKAIEQNYGAFVWFTIIHVFFFQSCINKAKVNMKVYGYLPSPGICISSLRSGRRVVNTYTILGDTRHPTNLPFENSLKEIQTLPWTYTTVSQWYTPCVAYSTRRRTRIDFTEKNISVRASYKINVFIVLKYGYWTSTALYWGSYELIMTVQSKRLCHRPLFPHHHLNLLNLFIQSDALRAQSGFTKCSFPT